MIENSLREFSIVKNNNTLRYKMQYSHIISKTLMKISGQFFQLNREFEYGVLDVALSVNRINSIVKNMCNASLYLNSCLAYCTQK